MILLDTSAIYALASADDPRHADSVRILASVEEAGESPFLHTYVLVESFSLIHRRHGLATARRIDGELESLPAVVVDRPLHSRAVARLRAQPRLKASLVDAVSFVVMEDRGVEEDFAFDPDFEKAGFRPLSAP